MMRILGVHSGGPVRVLHPVPYSPRRRKSRRAALEPISDCLKKSSISPAVCQRRCPPSPVTTWGRALTAFPGESNIHWITEYHGVPVPAASRRGSKGKQVQILCDPVTVRGEQDANTPLTTRSGRPRHAEILKPGNLPVCKRRDLGIPDHGELVMPRLAAESSLSSFSLGKGTFSF
jgi:hypothetical protein